MKRTETHQKSPEDETIQNFSLFTNHYSLPQGGTKWDKVGQGGTKWDKMRWLHRLIIDKSAIEKYKGRGTKYKLKVPRASGSPEYAEAEPKGNFQLYIVICPLYIPTNSDLAR